LAVRDASRAWARADGADPVDLVRLASVLWRLRVAPAAPRDCATTCLFALLTRDGRLVLGGLGDGVVALRSSADGSVETVLGRASGGFGNETLALGASKPGVGWVVREVPVGTQPFAVLLATDGVADDLEADRLLLFIGWLEEEFRDATPRARWRWLARELRSWPTPRHLDDKTVALMWRPEREEG